jgi:hypothetical protein
MAKAWHQTADGYQVKVEAKDHRQGVAPLALGVVPIIFDQVFNLEGSVVADGDFTGFVGPVLGAELGDTVIMTPIPGQAGSGDGWYGFTPGPVEVNATNSVRFHLQNRTASSIGPANPIGIRFTVFHILPAAPAYPEP